MNKTILKSFVVTISLEPGADLTERGWENFEDVYTQMLDDGEIAYMLQNMLCKYGLHRDSLETFEISYKESKP